MTKKAQKQKQATHAALSVDDFNAACEHLRKLPWEQSNPVLQIMSKAVGISIDAPDKEGKADG